MITPKKLKWIIFCIVAFFVALILFNIAKDAVMGYFLARYEPPPVTVSSVTAQTKNWQPYLSSIGNFVARNGVEVSSQAAGNIVKVQFESGEYVEAGAPLIDIDDSIEQAGLAFSQAEWTLRDINYTRMKELYKRKATASSSLDEAKASLDQAKANRDKIQAEIHQKHIIAPFSGQLGIRQVNLGQYITPGQTKIVTLQSLDPLYLHFYIPEQQYKNLYLNQPIIIQVENYPTYRFISKITAINPIADPNTHNVEVQATLPNCPEAVLNQTEQNTWVKFEKKPHSKLTYITCDSAQNAARHVTHFSFLPGMFASIKIQLPPIPNVIVLPSTAISYSLYGNAVYLITPLPQKDKSIPKNQQVHQVNRVFVDTGDEEGNAVIIKSGLKPGDQVVSAGELKLQNETRVIINNDIPLNSKPNLRELGQ